MPTPHDAFLNVPNLDHLVCQACTATQFSEAHYHRLVDMLPQAPRYHRKQWEYIYILRALEQFEMLTPERRGLGFGCGREPLAGVMVNHGLHVMVTDIPPHVDDSNWGIRSVMDSYYEGWCSRELYAQHVSFRPVDMNDIPDDLGTHDFVWSSCALEHLGSLKAGMDFVLNSTKCLKPGGIGVHTTELNISSEDETMETPELSLYRKKDFFALHAALCENGCSMLPLNFYFGNQPQDKYVDLPPYAMDPHLKLLIDRYTITSFGFVVRKN